MKIQYGLFNCFFQLALILSLCSGCVTTSTGGDEASAEAASTTNNASPAMEESAQQASNEAVAENTLSAKERRALDRKNREAEKARIAAQKKAEIEYEKAQKSQAKEDKKKLSLVKFFLETPVGSQDKIQSVQVYRSYPETIYIGTIDFLDERDIQDVNLIDTEEGGFQIEFLFNADGASILQNTTVRYRGRRIVIFANFGDPRYLGAPKITQSISDGIIRITPDASREEAERFVLGMKNTIRIIKKDDFGL